MLDNQRLYQASPDYLGREIAGEYVIVPIGGGALRMADMGVPNETFRFLWEQFQAPRTIDDVVEEARKQYQAPEGMIEADINRYVRECLQVGVLREVM